MFVELAVEDFLRRLHDGLGAARVEKAERAIGLGGGAFGQRQRRDQGARHTLFAPSILRRPFCAPALKPIPSVRSKYRRKPIGARRPSARGIILRLANSASRAP